MTVDWKKKLLPNLPYLLFVYLFDKLCVALVAAEPDFEVRCALCRAGKLSMIIYHGGSIYRGKICKVCCCVCVVYAALRKSVSLRKIGVDLDRVPSVNFIC